MTDKGSIHELYKGLISSRSWDAVKFGYHYNYSDKEFKEGKEYLEIYIKALDEQSNEAVLESGKSYYKETVYANPVLLAWHCMRLKVNSLEKRNKELLLQIEELQKQREFYRLKQQDFVNVAARVL